MSVAMATRIDLEAGCDFAECAEFAWPLYRQMSSGAYRECSVLEIPDELEEWLAEHRTARKRRSRAMARGYEFRPLAREEEADAIFAINISAPERQGRRMSEGYRERHEFGPLPEYRCARHAIRTSGVWTDRGELVAYLAMYRAGELALVSQILGHAEHLEAEIMYLLFAGALEREIAAGPGVVVYNRHDSGQDGLRFWKERNGFAEEVVEWAA